MTKPFMYQPIPLFLFLGVVAFFLFSPDLAWASSSQGLPFETPLEKLKDSITGPTGLTLSILAFGVAGVGIIFGSDFGSITKTACWILLGTSFITGGAGIIDKLFNFSAVLG